MENLKISVADILGRAGELKEVAVEGALPGVATALARVTEEPVRARLRLESVVEGILVTGRAHATTTFDCARCMKTFSGSTDPDLCELFAAPGSGVPKSEDVYRVHGVEIDLEPMLRDALALGLPLKPLCTADCQGLCAFCGGDLNLQTCDHTDDAHDPRWAPLAALKERLES